MTKIEEILSYKYEDGIHKWIFDTTRSNLIGWNRNPKLQKEISDWEVHKVFAGKYGLILNYPEDYVSIYILGFFLKNYTVLCLPDEQGEDSSLNKLNLQTQLVQWIYSTNIYHDQNYNYIINDEGFTECIYFSSIDPNNFSAYKMKASLTYGSKIYELLTANDIHQAVICGGNGDVSKCPNYYMVNRKEQYDTLLKILSGSDQPELDEVLDNCNFMIFDYKGEDIGYARQMKIYSKFNISDVILDIVHGFKKFSNQIKSYLLQCQALDEYEVNTLELYKKFKR